MWTLLQCGDLPQDESPVAWLDCVLPRRREAYESQYTRIRHTLEQAAFDRKATFFAADDRGPVGLIVITGEGPRKQVGLVGVRGDRRRLGLGKTLLERTLTALRSQGTTDLSAPGVNSANTAAVSLLTALGFEGQPTGGIRMRANEVFLIAEARSRRASNLYLELNSSHLCDGFVDELAEFLKPYRQHDAPGCPVAINIVNSVSSGNVILGDEWRIFPHDDLLYSLREHYGTEKVRLLYP